MQTFETSLHYRLVRTGDIDPLTKPKLFVDYMLGAFADCAREESLWLISMNPKRRPISQAPAALARGSRAGLRPPSLRNDRPLTRTMAPVAPRPRCLSRPSPLRHLRMRRPAKSPTVSDPRTRSIVI